MSSHCGFEGEILFVQNWEIVKVDLASFCALQKKTFKNIDDE